MLPGIVIATGLFKYLLRGSNAETVGWGSTFFGLWERLHSWER